MRKDIINMNPNKRKTVMQKKGFTLVEILMVVILTGIFLSIAGTNWIRKSERLRFQEIANQVYQHVMLAKQLSITHHENSIIEFNYAANQYKYYVDINGNNSADPGERLEVVKLENPPYEISVGTGETKVIFRPNGILLNMDEFEVKTKYKGDVSGTIRVTPAGMVELTEEKYN